MSHYPSNPYVGPRPFQRGENLYGRNHELMNLLNLIIAERIVMFYSPSGAGKTSLLQASLFPRLEKKKFRVLPIIRVNLEPPEDVEQPPSFNPYVYSSLVSLENDEAFKDEPIDSGVLAGLTFSEYLNRRREALGNPAKMVLIFDQFEEILTKDPANLRDKTEFFRQIGEALNDRTLWAVFSLREDYIAGLDPFLHHIPTRLNTTFRMDLLGEDAALEAVRKPAHEKGRDFTEPAAEKLVSDLRKVRFMKFDGSTVEKKGLYVEPVQLQVVCLRLWDNLPENAVQIVETDVEKIGNVDQALSDYYDACLENISNKIGANERQIRDWVDTQLITEQGIRGQVLKSAEKTQGLENRVIYELISKHLIRAEERRGATWFELAHDRLIEPVKKNNAAWRESHLSLLQRQSDLWEKQSRSDGLLLAGSELAEAETWAKNNPDFITPVETDFLEKSKARHEAVEREKKQTRIIIWTAVAAVFLMVWALTQKNLAEQKSKEALALKIGSKAVLTAQAPGPFDGYRDQALLLAVQSYKIDNTMQTQMNLLRTVLASRYLMSKSLLKSDEIPGGSITFSPDKTKVLYNIFSERNNNLLIFKDIKSGDLIGEPWKTNEETITFIAFNPDGKYVAIANKKGAIGNEKTTITLWNVNEGKQIGSTSMWYEGTITKMAFSSDNKHVICCFNNNTLILWDTDTGIGTQWIGKKQTKVENEGTEINTPFYTVAFSPDGNKVISGNKDGTLILWNLQNGTSIGKPWRKHRKSILCVAFSPDGKYVISGSSDNTLILWDSDTGEPVGQQWEGHRGSVISLDFSPDNKYVVSVGTDKTILLWEVPTGRQIGPPRQGHEVEISNITFTSDGTQIISIDIDGKIIKWPIDIETWVELACQRAGRNLTFDEWNRFIGDEYAYELTCPDTIVQSLNDYNVLLIGINDYQNIQDLRSSVNDIKLFRTILKNNGIVKSDKLRVLVDERATQINIVSRLEWLLKTNCDNNETILLYFNGRGSQIRDKNGDELQDHMDEIIVPYDHSWENPLTDDTFRSLLINKTCDVLLIIDAAHSGGFLDDLKEFDNVTFLASCQAYQEDAEININGKYHSAFSYFFLTGLKGNADENQDGFIVVSETFNYAKNQLKANGFSQIPIMKLGFDIVLMNFNK